MGTKLGWLDAAKWSAVAGLIGGVLAVVLPETQADTLAGYGDLVEGVALAVAGAAAAFVMAIRRK